LSYSPPATDGDQTLTVIHALDNIGDAYSFAAPASVAYPLANLAIYVPFSVSEAVTVQEGWVISGTVAGGNFDIGVYSAAGVRLTSSGSTARSASAVNNTTAMTNLDLAPGTRYYMAFSADTTANYIATASVAGLNEAMGILESTTSFVLPTNPTLSRTTRAYIPHFGLNLYTVAL
jgi:hypothetical protein